MIKKIFFLLTLAICISCTEDNIEITEDVIVQEKVDDKPEADDVPETENPSEEEQEKEEVEIDVELPQQWQLYKYICCANVETSGEDLEVMHTYDFKADKSFIKKRVKNNDTIAGAGTFEVVQVENDETVYKLSFDEMDHSVLSCTSREEEYLLLADDEVLTIDLRPCDGPKYFYKKQ